jgi:hypothetical protein
MWYSFYSITWIDISDAGEASEIINKGDLNETEIFGCSRTDKGC